MAAPPDAIPTTAFALMPAAALSVAVNLLDRCHTLTRAASPRGAPALPAITPWGGSDYSNDHGHAVRLGPSDTPKGRIDPSWLRREALNIAEPFRHRACLSAAAAAAVVAAATTIIAADRCRLLPPVISRRRISLFRRLILPCESPGEPRRPRTPRRRRPRPPTVSRSCSPARLASHAWRAVLGTLAPTLASLRTIRRTVVTTAHLCCLRLPLLPLSGLLY